MSSAPARAGGPLLEAEQLGKTFRHRRGLGTIEERALHDVSFQLHAGRVLALVGESGSGKSTLLRLLVRLLSPSSGRILFQGEDVLAREPKAASLRYRSQVQMIFQDPFGSLNPAHRVGYHLERPLLRHGKATRGDASERVDELLQAVDLTPARDFAEKYPHEMSGGQRQRVAIARALAVDPSVILADEPISMLDVSLRAGILNLLLRLKEERGIAYLYVTHDIASARYIGDETMVMVAGHIVEQAPSEALTTEPLHPYTRLLLAAVPDSTKNARQRAPLPAAPALGAPRAEGCPFAARCPEVKDVCRTTLPRLQSHAGKRLVRCHLYEETHLYPETE